MGNNTDKILKERGSRYGLYSPQAVFINRVNKEMREQLAQNPRAADLTEEQRCLILEGFNMVVNKMARCLQGDPLYMDNFEDIIGYARLVHDGILETLEDEKEET